LAAVALAAVAVAAGAPAEAQTSLGPVDVSGSVTLTGEAYGVSGIEARRPAVLGRAVASARFSLFGLGSTLALSLSTDEGSRVRQDLDKVRLATSWTWGQAELGDVAPSLSPYVLSGVTPRGGLVQLRRDVAGTPVEVTATGGLARRAVATAEAIGGLPAYDQWVWAGRVRAGRTTGTYGGLAVAAVREAEGSLDVDRAALAGRPQASVTVAPEGGLRLFDGALSLRALVATSAFVPDLGAPAGAADLSPLVAWAAPDRAGAFTASAVEGGLRADLAALGVLPEIGLGVDADYARVAPGYRTLGVPRLRDDEETLRLRPRLRLFEQRLLVDLDLGRTRTGLLADDADAGRRLSLGSTVQARLTDWFSVTANAVTLRTERDGGAFGDAAGDTLVASNLLQTTNAITLAPAAVFRADDGTSHTATLAATLQTARDRSDDVLAGGRPALDVDNLTGTAAYALALPSGLTASASADGSRSALGPNRSSRAGLTLGAGYALLDRALQLSASAGAARTNASYGLGDTAQTQLTGSVSATYRLPTGDPLRLQITGLSSSAGAGTPSFREIRARLAYSRRF